MHPNIVLLASLLLAMPAIAQNAPAMTDPSAAAVASLSYFEYGLPVINLPRTATAISPMDGQTLISGQKLRGGVEFPDHP